MYFRTRSSSSRAPCTTTTTTARRLPPTSTRGLRRSRSFINNYLNQYCKKRWWCHRTEGCQNYILILISTYVCNWKSNFLIWYTGHVYICIQYSKGARKKKLHFRRTRPLRMQVFLTCLLIREVQALDFFFLLLLCIFKSINFWGVIFNLRCFNLYELLYKCPIL